MPKGVYERTDLIKSKIKGRFKKGNIPCNKGKEHPKKLKKVELFKLGFPIECKYHGIHSKWRMHTGNNVQCFHCAAESQMKQRRRSPLKFIFRDASRHAKYHKRTFSISLEDLENKLLDQEGKCNLSGLEFNKENIVSLDRIDSSLGYELNNIQLIDSRINRMKTNLNQEEFLKLCKIIAYSQAREKKKKKK